MAYKPKGSYSAIMFDSIHRAEELQARVIENIHDKFQTESEANDIASLTWETFIAELEDAYANGTIDALNARYAQLLMPAITAAMQPPQEGEVR